MKYQNMTSKKYRVTNVTDSSSLLLHMFEPPDYSPPPSRSSSPSLRIDKTISYGGVCCLVKIFQALIVASLIYVLALVLQSIIFLDEKGGSKELLQDANTLIIPHIGLNQLPSPPSNQLLDLKNFEVRIDANQNLCDLQNLLFLIIIHSKVDHFHLRQAIRSTWGSLSGLGGDDYPHWKYKIVFILGESSASYDHLHDHNILASSISEAVDREAKKYGDLVVGSFPDLYRNLRYKHILGLRWAYERCSKAVFFIKADDDAFIDLPGLKSYLQRTLGPLSNHSANFIAGNVFPEGTKPLRTGKWAVSQDEYPWDHYPPFLGGLAYIMTPDVARNLFQAAHIKEIPSVWIDDVWVTGILRSSLRIHPLFLNAHYNYRQEAISKWLQSADKNLPPPSHFIHLDTSQPEWKKIVMELWQHILLAYNISHVSNYGDMLKPNERKLLKGFS